MTLLKTNEILDTFRKVQITKKGHFYHIIAVLSLQA